MTLGEWLLVASQLNEQVIGTEAVGGAGIRLSFTLIFSFSSSMNSGGNDQPSRFFFFFSFFFESI